MSPKLHNKLSALADRCESLAAEIRAALSEADDSNRRRSKAPAHNHRRRHRRDNPATQARFSRAGRYCPCRPTADHARADLPLAWWRQPRRQEAQGLRRRQNPLAGCSISPKAMTSSNSQRPETPNGKAPPEDLTPQSLADGPAWLAHSRSRVACSSQGLEGDGPPK